MTEHINNIGEYPSENDIMKALTDRHGIERQKKFKAAKVCICGLGGLGSNIAIMLARAGIGRLHIIDFDRVDITNLNRQQYRVAQLGKFKTEALKETLSEIMPYVEVVYDTVRIDDINMYELLKDDDIICEAFDNPYAKAMLVNGVLEHFPEKYLVAASGMAGMGSPNDIRTRRLSDHFYLCGDGVSDVNDDIGLVAARVMICAGHQAHTVLRLISGELK